MNFEIISNYFKKISKETKIEYNKFINEQKLTELGAFIFTITCISCINNFIKNYNKSVK